MNLWRPLIVAVALLLGAALEIAWQAGPAPAAEDPSAVASQESSPRLADRLFRVEWTAGATSQGQTRIIGYVYNESEHDAANVQLRISDLDASGRTVSYVIKPMGEPIPAAGRVSFDLQVAGTSPSYRVAVESFGLIDDPWTTKGTEQLLAAAAGARQPAVLRLCRPRSLQVSVRGDLDAVRTSASEGFRQRPVDCSRAGTERSRLGPLGTLALVLGFA